MSLYSSSWSPLPSLPDPEGFAGMYAGTCGETMICAGGTNFPDKPMLEGGAKTWTDRIFTLSPGENGWTEAGTLPAPYAYGASASTREGLLCIGGCGKEGHRKDVYLLSTADGAVTVTPFPPLPIALAYTAAAVLGGKVYLTGGCERPGGAGLHQPGFHAGRTRAGTGLAGAGPAAGPRTLPAPDGRGGRRPLRARRHRPPGGGRQTGPELLTEAWSFTPERGWTRLPEMPYAIAAAPTPAPVSRNGVIYLLGGDDGSGKKYTPQTNPGFNNQSLCLDTSAMEWHDAGPIAAPRAVLPCCAWQGRFAAVNGELKPGRRSPEVWSITLS